ncbi:uncharacterized protein LOC18010325 [Eutrema salsugineum]|uniref:uncharacterized protein LOC18010325 n=1 Tax=Eutrema salsugineum TaxID=72664 RepID=UPI000CED18E2|nr:uncharacterized protein LOC18010325 [Eutrema salsugineum]
MAGCYKNQLYLTAIAVTVILWVASQTVEAHFNRLCAQTAYPTLCQPLVKGSNLKRAVHSTICALENKTKQAIADAARFKNGNQQVAICHATLTDAAFNLAKAKTSIKKRNVLSLKMFLTAAVSDYGVCVNGFIDSRQVNAVQNAADALRKMGTNCLFLATLIDDRRTKPKKNKKKIN